MEQRIAELFNRIENSLDESVYTFSDSEYLVRRELVKFLSEQNGLVASARHVDAEEVVKTIIASVISTDFSQGEPLNWLREAASVVLDFYDLAYNNEMSETAGKFCSLLPLGHPRAQRVVPVTASVYRAALAEWMAADPRLDELGRNQVYAFYSLTGSDQIKADFESLKLQTLIASGAVPEELDPLVAAFNMSWAQRSAMAKALAPFRRRDRKKRFADEYGRLKGWFSNGKEIFSATTRIVGPGPDNDTYQVQSDGSDPRIPKGIYMQKASMSENIDAVLSPSTLNRLLKGKKGAKEYVSPKDAQYAVPLDEFLATKQEAPTGWTKVKGKTGQLGYKNEQGVYAFRASAKEVSALGKPGIISGTGDKDALDPSNPDNFLIKDKNGRQIGVAQDWAGIEEIVAAEAARPTPPTGPKGSEEKFKSPDGTLPTPPKLPEGSSGLLKKDKDGNYSFENDEGSVNVYQDDDGNWVADTNYQTMLDENVEGAIEEAKKFKSKEEAIKHAENFADKLKNKPDELWQEAYDKKYEDAINVSARRDETSKYDTDALADGYAISKAGKDKYQIDGATENGDDILIEKGSNGKWYVSELGGSAPDNFTDRELGEFDSPEEAFEFANSQRTSPIEFDKDAADEAMSTADVSAQRESSSGKLDRSKLTPGQIKKYGKDLDDMDKAIANNDMEKVLKYKNFYAQDENMPPEVWEAINSSEEVLRNKKRDIDNAIYSSDKDELEALANDPQNAGWRDKIQSAIDIFDSEDVSANRDEAPVKEPSPAQLEPATNKQYSLLKEYLDERDLDPATQAAITDALENKNLTKHQVNSIIGTAKSANFKDGVDGSKPSQRMLDSLQGYLQTKDLRPSEIVEVLDSLESDGSRENVDNLLNKLRRKKDKPVALNKGMGSMTRFEDGDYSWSDDYNNVDVMKRPDGQWEVDYTEPDLNDRGGTKNRSTMFGSEKEALDFANELIKQNQEDNGVSRAEDNLKANRDVLDTSAPGAKSGTGKLAEPATDPQYNLLSSLLDGKEITDPDAFAAARDAIEFRNLSKGQIGELIGKLRAMGDKPGARRGPTAKQIASIKRGMIERGLSPEERKDLEDRLEAGLSFEEASDILNDLKSREITPEGMKDLLDSYKDPVDLGNLMYLLDKPEYQPYKANIEDAIDRITGIEPAARPALLRDSQDISAKRDISNLNRGLGERPSAGEIDQEGRDIIDEIESAGPISDETDEEFRDRIQSYRDELKRFVDAVRIGSPDITESTGIRLDRSTTSSDIVPLLDELEGLAAKARTRQPSNVDSDQDIDLDQDVPGASTRDRLAEKLAEDLDALDSLAVDGDELKTYLEEFDQTDYAYTAIEMVTQIENMSRYVNDPELKQRLSDLSSRLTDEIVDRFGVAEAARGDDDDIIDLYDYSEKVREEIEIYFETDADTIVEKLDENGYYGDNRSGGAEARVSENEDGTYTARVDYDRDGEEQTFEDRDEALAWAANEVAKYNSNVIPNTYDKDIDLEEEAQNAKTDAEAAAFADRLDEIARDLDENRGDPRAARELRSYGERIRDMIEKRDRQNQSEVESEPLNSETIDEMATDPNLNPAGYAQYVGDDLYRQLEASEKADPTGITNMTDGRPTLDSYESPDGRVKVKIDYDADFDGDGFVDASSYTVTIDGVRVGGKSLGFSDDVAADVQGLIEEHFSKKA